MLQIPELLAPAGDLERLRYAINYGADAVYCSLPEFGMRSAPANFTPEQLTEGVIYAHARGRKVYLTMNTLPTNEEADRLPDAIKEAAKAGVDAFIVADLGVLDACKTVAPDIDVHMSTQTGITNWAAARAAYNLGAKRVVLAREMSLQDIAILRDKLDYLGEESCSSEERELAALTEFPPLNVCCYPAVPEKYRVVRKNPWHLSEDASRVFQSIAVEAGDPKLLHRLKDYEQHPTKRRARQIARLLHRNAHAKTVDLLSRKLQKASSAYPSRTFGKAQQTRHLALELLAQKRQKELEKRGIRSELLREEPFTTAQDSIEFKVHLMIWEKGILNRKARIETWEDK